MIKTTLCYIEKENKYLMMLRGKKENDPNVGKWLGIGGKFQEGETPEECMLREVREETGLELVDYHFHGIIKFRSDIWEDEDMYLYSARAPLGATEDNNGSESNTIDCAEGELEWIDKSRILELPLWEGDRLFLEQLLRGERDINMTLSYKGEELVSATL